MGTKRNVKCNRSSAKRQILCCSQRKIARNATIVDHPLIILAKRSFAPPTIPSIGPAPGAPATLERTTSKPHGRRVAMSQNYRLAFLSQFLRRCLFLASRAGGVHARA
jgi:hypothetical protein